MSVVHKDLDGLVLGTTNASYRRSIGAEALALCLKSGQAGSWIVHVVTFLTEVQPDLILEFAELHGISTSELACAYDAMKAATGEANPALEMTLVQLAPAA
jgi:hypothetical protein